MALTKLEVRQIALAAPIVGFVSAAGTVTNADTIETAIEKIDGNQQAGQIQIEQTIASIAGNYSQSIM